MRTLKKTFTTWALCAGGLLAALTVSAQDPFAGGSSVVTNALFTKLIGTTTFFTARAEMRVLDREQRESLNMSMKIAMRDGKMRSDVDMTQFKSDGLPPEAIANLKPMGMDRFVSIERPDKKTTFLIYPSLQAYLKAETLDRKPKIEKTEIGRETIDGHPCIKNKVIVTNDQGEKLEATIWNATDLKDFPVQIQMQEKDTTIMMSYKQVQFVKPDAKQFELPADYKQYGDIQQLMQKAMEKFQADLGTNK